MFKCQSVLLSQVISFRGTATYQLNNGEPLSSNYHDHDSPGAVDSARPPSNVEPDQLLPGQPGGGRHGHGHV